MTRNLTEVTEILCRLTTDVGNRLFKNEVPHDCFCHGRDGFQAMDNAVLQFVQAAVIDAIAKVEEARLQPNTIVSIVDGRMKTEPRPPRHLETMPRRVPFSPGPGQTWKDCPHAGYYVVRDCSWPSKMCSDCNTYLGDFD